MKSHDEEDMKRKDMEGLWSKYKLAVFKPDTAQLADFLIFQLIWQCKKE